MSRLTSTSSILKSVLIGQQSFHKMTAETDLSRLSRLHLEDDSDDKENIEMNKNKSSRSMLMSESPSVKKSSRKSVKDPSKNALDAVESYFLAHNGGGKSSRQVTSKRTLQSLSTGGHPGLPDPLLFETLKTSHQSSHQHIAIASELQAKISKHLSPRWNIYLKQDFNILLHGVGSKRNILNEFRSKYLGKNKCIVVRGYDVSVSINQIITTIYESFVRSSDQGTRNVGEQFSTILTHFSSPDACPPLYLVIHNIDGPALRVNKSQASLSHLASLDSIRLIASVDNPYTPLLWSPDEWARFNWIWQDCSSLADYSAEVSFNNSPLLHQLLDGDGGGQTIGGGSMAASLRQVMASSTQNARKIYQMLAEHQLGVPLGKTTATTTTDGMTLENLYWRCRDSFLTNSETTLRAQLTEFRDHKLLKIRKIEDGSEVLYIPLEKSLIEHFIQNFDSYC